MFDRFKIVLSDMKTYPFGEGVHYSWMINMNKLREYNDYKVKSVVLADIDDKDCFWYFDIVIYKDGETEE